MTNKSRQGLRIILLTLCGLATGATLARFMVAQSPEMQQRVAETMDAAAKNRQALAQYTWVEQVTTSLKGEQKKQQHFQVSLGPDGKPQKTSLDPPTPEENGGGRLKRHIVEKKKEEYQEYADQIKELIQQYVPPNRTLLSQARQRGDIMVGQQPGAQSQFRLVVSNYIKPGDKMTLVMDRAQKDLVSLAIGTYLNDPSDAVKVAAQFDRIPGGPNHVSAETINGVSKQLTLAIQNSSYRPR